MSRSRIFPSLSSSRQMMMAWKVSGDFAQARDHRLAAGLDALGDGDLALARQELDGAHLAQIHPDRIVGAVHRLGGTLDLHGQVFGGPLGLLGRLLGGLFILHDVDAHLGEHRHRVLDLLGGDLFGGKNLVQLVVSDIAALLGKLDHPLDGGIGQVEQRAVRRFGGRFRRVPFVGSLRCDLLFRFGFAHLNSCHRVSNLTLAVSDRWNHLIRSLFPRPVRIRSVALTSA